jgi:hypothetical protein
LTILAYCVAWAGIISGIWLLFSKAEETLKPEVRTAISNWLSNLNPGGKSTNWPTTFAAVFDNVFSKKLSSFRCILISYIVSIIAVIILTIIWLAINPEGFYFVFKADVKTKILQCLLFLCMFNFSADFFSLLVTRYIISKMSKTSSTTKTIGYLAIDFSVTIIVFVVVAEAFLFFVAMLHSYFPKWYTSRGHEVFEYKQMIAYLIELFQYGIFFKSSDDSVPTLGVYFYSTFFTSIWVWVYVMSGLAVKVGVMSSELLISTRRIFDIEKKPLRSMGYVCMVIVSIIFLVVPFAKLLF